MCDPTALLDLVPGEGLLKRPSMDYNEYTYCYGGGRGGWHFFPRCSTTVHGHRESARARRGTNVIFYRPRLDRAIRCILYTVLETGLSKASEKSRWAERILFNCRQESLRANSHRNTVIALIFLHLKLAIVLCIVRKFIGDYEENY